MNKLKHFSFLMMLCASLGFITSCNNDDDGDGAEIRDAIVSWSLTGACTQTENITFVDNKPTSSVLNVCMYNGTNQSFSVVFTELSSAWTWGWAATGVSQLITGTYTLELGGGYGSTCAAGFESVSSELNITSVSSAEDVGNPGDKYITGTITIVFENGDTPPATFTLQGSFTDLYIPYSN